MQPNRTIPRFNLLRAHGSPTGFWYTKGCRCASCVAARRAYRRHWRIERYEVAHASDLRWAQHHRDRMRRLRAENPEAIHEQDRLRTLRDAERLRVRYAERADYHRARAIRWAKANPEKKAANNRNRRARLASAPGTHTAADIRAQHERQRNRCYWCGEPAGKRYHVDHVVPLNLGGSNGPENLVIACPACNCAKKAKHPMDFAGRML